MWLPSEEGFGHPAGVENVMRDKEKAKERERAAQTSAVESSRRHKREEIVNRVVWESGERTEKIRK